MVTTDRAPSTISLILAMNDQGIIGYQNQLPWHLPADMKYFKTITLGKPVLMGRKTYESLGKPLSGRRNIIISRNTEFLAPGCEVVSSFSAALALCQDAEEVMVIGGAQIYAAALPYANRIYLTRVHGHFMGDTYFPALNPREWQEVSREDHLPDEKNRYPYSFIVLQHKLGPRTSHSR